MSATLRAINPATGFQAVARGPVRRGPDFVLPEPTLDDLDEWWRRFYDGEQDPASRIPPERADTEHDYFQLSWVREHTLLDKAGTPLVPIVDELAILNSGYVHTGPSTFWLEGFCVHEGRPAFLSIGRHLGFLIHEGAIRYVTSGAGESVDRAGLERHLSKERIPFDRWLNELPGLIQL